MRKGTHVRNRCPAPTLFGGFLVFLRGTAALLLAASLLLGGASGAAAGSAGGLSPAAATVIAVFGIGEILLAWFILRGGNRSRVGAMLLSVVAIIVQAADVLNGGPRVALETNLVGLSLDILLIIALSSQRSRTFARNHGRAPVLQKRV